MPPIAGLAIAIGAWHFALAGGLVPPGSLPYPAQVAGVLVEMLGERQVWGSLWQTMRGALVGLIIATIIGVLLGTLLGRLRFADDSARLLIQFLRPIPPIALLPLVLLLLGPSEAMKIALVVWGCAWPVMLQTADGVRSIDPLMLQVARSYRLGRAVTWRSVVVPAMSPYIMAGVRVAASVALLVAVTAELIGGAKGIGKMTSDAGLVGQTTRVYAYVVLAGMLGVLINVALARLEGRLLGWHGPHRREAGHGGRG